MRQRTLKLLLDAPLRVACLQAFAACGLPQGMLCAGFVRNAIWDEVFGLRSAWADVDVAYFDPADLSPARWQLRNQARMHRYSGVAPYVSAMDAVSRFPETATCLAVCLDAQGVPSMPVTLGLADAWAGIVRPNPRCAEAGGIVAQRLASKDWLGKWPALRLCV